MRTERDLDDAIDRAVREILSVEPRPGFRARVLARVDRRPESPAAAWRWVAATALAAGVLLAVVLLRPSSTPRAPEMAANQTAAPGAPRTAPPVPVTAAPEPPASATASAPATPTPARRKPTAQTPVRFPPQGMVAAATVPAGSTRASDAAGARPLPDLSGSDPIRISAIAIPPVSLERIAIAPIPPSR